MTIPIQGTIVQLITGGSVVVDSTTTDVSGEYIFTNVPSTAYTVSTAAYNITEPLSAYIDLIVQPASNNVPLTVTSGSINQVDFEYPLIIDNKTEIHIIVDDSGSMDKAAIAIELMQRTVLQACLIQLYDGDVNEYNDRVRVYFVGDDNDTTYVHPTQPVARGPRSSPASLPDSPWTPPGWYLDPHPYGHNERPISWAAFGPQVEDTTKVINLIFSDESTPYGAGNGTPNFWESANSNKLPDVLKQDIGFVKNSIAAAKAEKKFITSIMFIGTVRPSYSDWLERLYKALETTIVWNTGQTVQWTSGAGNKLFQISDYNFVEEAANNNIGFDYNTNLLTTDPNYYLNVIVTALNANGYVLTCS